MKFTAKEYYDLLIYFVGGQLFIVKASVLGVFNVFGDHYDPKEPKNKGKAALLVGQGWLYGFHTGETIEVQRISLVTVYVSRVYKPYMYMFTIRQ